MHIDFDEANAVGHRPDSRGRIVFDSERIKLENKPLSKEETSSELKECFIEKKLISEEMIKELVKSEPKIVNIPKASILTPLAVDFIKEKRIVFQAWRCGEREIRCANRNHHHYHQASRRFLYVPYSHHRL